MDKVMNDELVDLASASEARTDAKTASARASRRGLFGSLGTVVGGAVLLAGLGELARASVAEAAATVTYTASGAANEAVRGEGSNGATGVDGVSDTGDGVSGWSRYIGVLGVGDGEGIGVMGVARGTRFGGQFTAQSSPAIYCVSNASTTAGGVILNNGSGNGLAAAATVNGVGVVAEGGTGLLARTIAPNGLGLVVDGRIEVRGNAVGEAVLVAEARSVTVSNPAATPDSVIVLTPLANPGGPLWISAQSAGSFTIERASSEEGRQGRLRATPVRYLIVN